MGGIFVNDGVVSGHMLHLYEASDITLSEIRRILTFVTNEEIQGTEKTDGQNLYVSYNVEEGQSRAARNKTMLRKGGVNPEELAEKFKDRGLVETVFNRAFKAFDTAAKQLPKEKQRKLFGDNANVFYNVEIQDPENKNVFLYDEPTLNFHRLGHFNIDYNTGNLTTENIEKKVSILESFIEEMNSAVEGYNLTVNPLRSLPKMNEEKRNNLLLEIENIFTNEGLNSKSTIAELVEVKIRKFIDRSEFNSNKRLCEALIERFVTGKKSGNCSLKEMKKMTADPTSLSSFVSKNDGNLKRESLLNLESAIHKFAVEALTGFNSSFILETELETKRLNDLVQERILQINNNKRLTREYKKHIDKLTEINTTAEGFVFNIGERVYKLTGNFAPMNQILGSARYKEEEKMNNKKIAIIPGGFKPPHKGHMEMVKHYSDMADQVVVLISPLSRKTPNGQEITAEQSKQLFNLYNEAMNLKNVVYHITENNSPVQEAYDMLENMPAGISVCFGVSKKGNDQERFAAHRLQKVAPAGVVVEEDFYSPQSEAISATKLRNLLENDGDITSFIPSGVAISEVKQILGKGQSPSSESSLVELSTSGAVAGYAGPVGTQKKNKKFPTNYREMQENYFIKREDLMEELRLREAIRKIITENKKKELNEEQRLRKVIRRMLTEGKKADEVIYQSTGVNALRDLLANVGPIIKDKYRNLATSAKQREAFKNHLLIGWRNLLNIADISKGVEDKRAPKSLDDIELEEDIEIKIKKQDPSSLLADFEPKEYEPLKSKEQKLVAGGELPTDPDQKTGMNAAAECLNLISSQTLTSYEQLFNPQDAEDFKEYGLANIAAYLDEIEAEMTVAPEIDIETPEGSVEVEEPATVEDQLDLSEDLLHKLANLL